MNRRTLAFIVKKLVFSRKNRGIVHIISIISLVGIMVVSCALVLVLSVFNGFTSVAEDMLSKKCPPILINAKQGTTIDYNTIEILNSLEEIQRNIPIIKQTAMVVCMNEKIICDIVGIDSSYFLYNRLDTCIVNGKENMKAPIYIDSNFCLMGIGSALNCGLNKGAEKMFLPVKITVPNTKNKDAVFLEDKLNSETVIYTACFQTHSDLDDNTVFISIEKARKLLNMPKNTCSFVYVIPKTKDINALCSRIKKNLGSRFEVKNILEQEPVYFRIVKSEKLAIYVILAFIIFIATINIISSIIILYIEKEKMNMIFRIIGVEMKDLRKVYFFYGLNLNIIGCLAGVILAVVLCLLQQHFGFITLAKDSYVVDAYPVRIFALDIIKVIIIVLCIGTLSIKLVTQSIKTKN